MPLNDCVFVFLWVWSKRRPNSDVAQKGLCGDGYEVNSHVLMLFSCRVTDKSKPLLQTSKCWSYYRYEKCKCMSIPVTLVLFYPQFLYIRNTFFHLCISTCKFYSCVIRCFCSVAMSNNHPNAFLIYKPVLCFFFLLQPLLHKDWI